MYLKAKEHNIRLSVLSNFKELVSSIYNMNIDVKCQC